LQFVLEERKFCVEFVFAEGKFCESWCWLGDAFGLGFLIFDCCAIDDNGVVFSVVGVLDYMCFGEGAVGGVVVGDLFVRDFFVCFLIVGVGFGAVGWFEEIFGFDRRGYAFFTTAVIGIMAGCWGWSFLTCVFELIRSLASYTVQRISLSGPRRYHNGTNSSSNDGVL
jgi:hypothetical protein